MVKLKLSKLCSFQGVWIIAQCHHTALLWSLLKSSTIACMQTQWQVQMESHCFIKMFPKFSLVPLPGSVSGGTYVSVVGTDFLPGVQLVDLIMWTVLPQHGFHLTKLSVWHSSLRWGICDCVEVTNNADARIKSHFVPDVTVTALSPTSETKNGGTLSLYQQRMLFQQTRFTVDLVSRMSLLSKVRGAVHHK